jgi:hypothetical protein
MNELETIRKKIREDLNDLADVLATGGAASFEMYKQLVGKIEGLALAERYILDLQERLMKEDLL